MAPATGALTSETSVVKTGIDAGTGGNDSGTATGSAVGVGAAVVSVVGASSSDFAAW